MSFPTLQHRQGVDYGEESNVQSLHAAIRREKRDGCVTITPFPLWALVVFGLAFFVAGFWSARSGGTHFTATSIESGNPPPSPATLPALQAGAGSASAVQSPVENANAPVLVHVVMKNMKFDPATIEVKSGDTIEWTNQDMTPHTATSAKFDSASIDSDKSWRHTFTEVGDFAYRCTFHPDMKGAVIVK